MAERKKFKLVRTLLGWIFFLALVSGPAGYFYTREPVIDVTAMTLKRGRVEQTIAALSAGTVEPKQSSMVAAESIGKVVAIPVKEGMRVNKGDVLVELDATLQQYQVDQAEKRIQQMEKGVELLRQQSRHDASRVDTLKRTRDLAAVEFNRDKTLYEKEEVGSETMVNLAEIQFNQVEDTYKMVSDLVHLYPLRIQEAETGLSAMSIMREQAATAFNWTKVRAPFSGLVAEVYLEVGESVGSSLGGGDLSAGALGGGGGLGAGLGGGALGGGGGGMSMASPMAVVQLVDDSDLYVKAPFDEANFGQIQVGQKVRITIDAYRDEEFPGRVDSISSVVKRNLDLSRTFVVDILIEEGKEKLIPGMSADAIIIANEKEDVLLVPTEALIREEEGYVIEDGRAVRRKVEIGIGNWLEREVASGLKEGETLITSVSRKELRDGIKVNVVQALEEK